MRKISVVLKIFYLLLPLNAYATGHQFLVKYSNTEGLTGQHIRSCSQDAQGRMWIGTGNGVFFYEGEGFHAFDDYDYMQNCTKMTFAVCCDSGRRVWIASSNGAGYYDTALGKFIPVDGFNTIPARDLDTDPEGNVWITSRSGIWKYDSGRRSVTGVATVLDYHPELSCFSSDGSNLFILSAEGTVVRHELASGHNIEIFAPHGRARAAAIAASEKGGVDVALDNGRILRFDIESRRPYRILNIADRIGNSTITALLEKDGLLWIGTSSGMLVYNLSTRVLDDQTGSDEEPFRLSGLVVREIFADADGNIWVGTANGGLHVWMSYGGHFKRFVADGDDSSLAGTSIRAICSDRRGNIWTGSEEGQLSCFNPASETFEDFSVRSGIRYGTVITSIKEVGGMLWIATYGDGLIEFDPVAGRTVRKSAGETDRFFALTTDHNGVIRAGTDIGIFSVDKASGALMRENPALGFPVHSLTEDSYGRIWMGTYGQGVCYWTPGTPELVLIPYSSKGENPLSSNYINYLFNDSEDDLWICSQGSGLARISFSADGSITGASHIDTQSGLPSNDVNAAFEAPDGHIWVLTTNGMAEISRETMRVLKVYMQSDEVIGKFFNPASCLMTGDSQAYVGTYRGLLSFNPAMMGELFEMKPVHINGIITGTNGDFGPSIGGGAASVHYEDFKIRWKDASMVTVAFSTYDYANPNLQQFDCELKRYGFTSSITTGDNSTSYVGLRAGHYTFTVSALGDRTGDTADTIHFAIVPPWYKSLTAQIAYFILALGALAWWIKRKKDEHERVAKFKEAQGKMQILHDQMGFLTNVTHEIRTPVTMMTILMDRIFKKKDVEQDEDLLSMKSNMNKLLELCDQMLDYRKVENEQTRLHPDDEALNGLVQAAVESFRPAAEARGMGFVVSTPSHPVLARCDRNAVESILGNLLSNAVKYGSSRISLELTSSEKEAVISVESDGKPIPKDESELIFNAFYQSDPGRSAGTGIGLTYARALANMQNGRLFLDTEKNDANRFVFTLPLSIQGEVAPETVPSLPSDEEPEEWKESEGKPLILVVEDNENLRKVISEELSDDYLTLTASDGAEALDIIKRENVDLVVSDIMMPVMDGCSLCNAIKDDLHTSHIMVILLTAAIGVDNHIKSLKAGADGYIEKPFRVELLKENIRNLFRNREIRNEQFASSPLSHFRCASFSSVEQDFMETLNNYIFEHISDTDMSADRLADAMRTTRKTLASKISANTGLTVNEYVRTCRLKKAAELLSKNKYRINEVGYLVGYSTPSYFTKHFTAQFGMKPSDFLKSL